MLYDYSKLKGRIVEMFNSNYAFAYHMGISERTLSLKLNNKVYWKQPEITKALSLLELTEDDVKDYFFTYLVQFS
ncbi:TPA: DUF739 family protein [Enterococcus faecalis]